MGDKQAVGHRKTQTHNEVERGSHKSDEAQVHPFDTYMADKWQKTVEDQVCRASLCQITES
jgi:hypothetical protein